MKMLNSLKSQRLNDLYAKVYRQMLRREAKIGGRVFGPVAEGNRREFFCLDQNTWVWHEEWTDQNGKRHVVTTRYDIRPNGILKVQDGQPHHYISQAETRNLYNAAYEYYQRISSEVYGLAA